MEKGKVGCNPPAYVDCRNSNGKEECRSYLHQWISSGKFWNCSVFANIPVKQVACGEEHLIFVSDCSQVFSLGGNNYGQLGLGDYVERKDPSEIRSLSEKHVSRVSSGTRHSCAITEEGDVFCWGDSRLGQCGNGRTGIFPTPCKIEFIDSSGPSVIPSVKVQEIACGSKHTLAIDSQGTLWSWGFGHSTGLGQGGGEVLAPKKVTKMRYCTVVQIACGKFHSVALVQEDGNLGQHTIKSSKSLDSMVERKHAQKTTGSRNNKPGSAKSKSSPVETSDVKLIDQSVTEFHYSSLDVQNKQQNESMPNASSISELQKVGPMGLCGVCKVWTWGDNMYGQLGIGSRDLQDSAEPMLVTRLDNKDIISIAAGSFHTLALTRKCQVYGWGDNSSGQMSGDMRDDMYFMPVKITALDNMQVWDVAAGAFFSVFLADSKGDTSHIFQMDGVMKSEIGAANPCFQEAGSRRSSTLDKFKRSFKRGNKGSSTDLSSFALYFDRKLKKIDVRRDFILRTIKGCGDQFACITMSDTCQLFKEMHSFARSERWYFYQLSLIQEYITTPLQKTEQWTATTRLPGGEVLLSLSDCFSELLRLIGIGLSQLTYVIKNDLEVKDLLSFFVSDSVLACYEWYSNCYCNALAVGHFDSLSKAVCGIAKKANGPIEELLHSLNMEEPDFAKFMYIPFNRLLHYADFVGKLAKIVKEPECSGQLERIFKELMEYSKPTTIRLRGAEETRQFWKDSSPELNEALKCPHRRLICKTSNLSLAFASKSTTRTFTLFNDVFVQSQSNKDFQVFQLVTMWVEPIADTKEHKNSLRITTPEGSFVLSSDSASFTTEWVKKLNNAIAERLSFTPLNRKIRLDSVSSKTGLLRQANSREASHTYSYDLKYKSATYSGEWMHGKPHGRGNMKWPDGTVYNGEFKDGSFDGYGTMQFSSTSGDVRLQYEGDWYGGKMNGFGQMKYKNKSDYTGHWRNDERHGHGSLKAYSADGKCLQTEYVGDWQSDQKNGYGVQDFIVSGEKYIGMWQNDQREGFGIVVTVDGVYYEGPFSQNKLAGTGTLRSDDDTCYEGEFAADMQLRGKGVLTLPNGDCIDGTFDGKWGDDISMTGKFCKRLNQHPRGLEIEETELSQQKATESKVPAKMKWTSLFKECKDEINGRSNLEEPGLSVWDNIERSIAMKRSSAIRKRCSRKVKEEDSEFAAERKEVNCYDFNEIQNFLKKAIETDGHPLHTLVESLAEVYRTTYVGVGAHRRLLLHAVEEAKSYVLRLFDVIKCLLPDLPDEDFVAPSQDTADGPVQPPINRNLLLHPLLLPRLYNPLFTLYALHSAKADEAYMERLHQLNKRGDIALMSFLEIKRKYMLCKVDEETKKLVVGDEPPYQSAITELRNITEKRSPMEKFYVIRKSIEKIHKAIDKFCQGEEVFIGADDELPIFQYVVMRAKILRLGAEIQFIDDLVEPSLLKGEVGYRLNGLRICYHQIQHEKDKNETDKNE